MKYNFIKSLVLITGLSFVGCTNVEDETSFAVNDKPTLTVLNNQVTVMEGEDIVLNFTTDYQISSASDFKVDLLFDTADEDDVSMVLDEATLAIEAWGPDGYKFSYPAFTTNYTLTIGSAIIDALADGGDKFQIKISSMGNMLTKINPDNQIIDVTIESVPNLFVAELDWDYGYFDAAGDEVDLDFDIEVYDSGFNLYDDSYYDHPERITFDASTPDGDYYILAELYSTMDAVPSTDPIPSTITFNKETYSESVDLSSFFNTQDGGLAEGNANFYVMFSVNKTGNVYTVLDQNGDTVVSGRQSSIAQILANKAGRKK